VTPVVALARLERLRKDAVIGEREWMVAREAMLDLAGESSGRRTRAAAYDSLEVAIGAPLLIEDTLARPAPGRYAWSSLALEVSPEELRRRILGTPYCSCPERWDDLLDKLELLRQHRQGEKLTVRQFDGVKYTLMGRLRWLDLVGELLWLGRHADTWEYWMREDGWAVGSEEIRACRESMLAFHAPAGLDQRDRDVWSVDRCWQFYDDAIATGDVQYLEGSHVVKLDRSEWSF